MSQNSLWLMRYQTRGTNFTFKESFKLCVIFLQNFLPNPKCFWLICNQETKLLPPMVKWCIENLKTEYFCGIHFASNQLLTNLLK